MNTLTKLVIIVTAVVNSYSLAGQSVMLETMAGDKNYWYQHTVAMPFSTESKFSFFHTSSLHFMYDEGEKNELMSQSYLVYSLGRSVRAAVGTFYATVPGFSASAAMQFSFGHGHLRGVVVPRIDLKSHSSYEVMTLAEYTPPINERLNFYSRLQLMSNYSSDSHNRSYQNIRLGVRADQFTFGFALNVDERGPETQTQRNWGAFLRYDMKNR